MKKVSFFLLLNILAPFIIILAEREQVLQISVIKLVFILHINKVRKEKID
jgi:hypothetical protein